MLPRGARLAELVEFGLNFSRIRETSPGKVRPPLSFNLRGRHWLLLASFGAAAACSHPKSEAAGKNVDAKGLASPPSPSAPPRSRPAERIAIPSGTLVAGSLPGEEGRVPELEAKHVHVELGPYGIDRLPYPNDPGQPPLRGVTKEKAQRLCAERSARLCTELEWEHACKGPAQTAFASGATWDDRCSKSAEACASGFDVLGLGSSAGEWVANELPSDDGKLRLIARGAGASAPAADHRCAARHLFSADTESQELGFRCCDGAPNAAVVAEPIKGQLFRIEKPNLAEFERALAEDVHGKRLAKDLKFFREDGANTVVARGAGDKKGFEFTVAPLRWSPVAGTDFLVVAARSGESTSFVAAFYVLPDQHYKLISTFVLENEPGPVALAYSPDIRPRIHFSTCWGCPGETGKALFRKPESIVLLQP